MPRGSPHERRRAVALAERKSVRRTHSGGLLPGKPRNQVYPQTWRSVSALRFFLWKIYGMGRLKVSNL